MSIASNDGVLYISLGDGDVGAGVVQTTTGPAIVFARIHKQEIGALWPGNWGKAVLVLSISNAAALHVLSAAVQRLSELPMPEPEGVWLASDPTT